MAASTVSRSTWTDDDGSGTTGTIIGNARLQADVYDVIDQVFSGAGAYATLELGGKLKIDSVAVDGLSLVGGIDWTGIAAPAVSGSSKVRLYSDTNGRLRLSENALAYRTVAPIASLPTTVAAVVNTVTETTVLSFTVPANSMADGDVVGSWFTGIKKNTSGSGAHIITFKLYWGGVLIGTIGAGSFSDAATYNALYELRMQRVGADLWAFNSNVGAGGFSDLPLAQFVAAQPASSVLAAAGFGTDKLVELKVTLAVADANFSFTANAARALRMGL